MNKKFLKYIVVLLFLFLPSGVLANDLEITCFSDKKPEIVRNKDPLFQISGFLPGDKAERTIFFENTDQVNDCRIYFNVKGTSNNLTDKIDVSIPTLFNNTLSEYMRSSILMADLVPNQKITRTITMELPTDAGNTYADKLASFDITVVSQWGTGETSAESTGEGGSILGISDARGVRGIGSVLGATDGILPRTGQAIILVVSASLFLIAGYYLYKRKKSLKTATSQKP